MGLLDDQTYGEYLDLYQQQNTYIGTPGDQYRFVTLENIISAFMVAYVGEDKIINKVSRTDVQFHAMRAIQELSYDVLRSIKALEWEVSNRLSAPLPQDYVNYVKVVKVDANGVELLLHPARNTSNPAPITQNLANNWTINVNDDLSTLSVSDTLSNFNEQAVSEVSTNEPNDLEFDNRGRRYGLDPQYAQGNGVFYIDNLQQTIRFGSSLAGETVTLHYISDGLGTDDEMVVHKFCEEACYKHIAYGVLATKSNVPEYIVQRYKKEKFAETRKAKIRLSSIKIEEFTQVLKGLSKPIK